MEIHFKIQCIFVAVLLSFIACNSNQTIPSDKKEDTSRDAVDSIDSASSVSTDSIRVNPDVKKDTVKR